MKPMPTPLRESVAGVFLAALILGTLAPGTPATAASLQWTNVAGGTWSAPSNWSPNLVPGPADAVVITAAGTYTINVDGPLEIGSLSLGGPTGAQTLDLAGRSLRLSGASSIGERGVLIAGSNLAQQEAALTIRGRLQWPGGSVSGNVVLASGGTGVVEDGADHELFGTLTIRNGGRLNWSAGRLYLENGSALVNEAGGVIDKRSGDALEERGTGPNRFVNQGLVQKSSGAFAAPINVEFVQQGTVEVLEGTLQFPRGFTSRGTFSVAEGARVDLRGGVFVFEPGHAFGGPGFYGIEGGDATVVGDLTAPNFQLRGGILRGTNRITGTLVWQAGQWVGQPSVASGGVLRIEGGADHEFTGSLTNQNGGTVRWTAGRLYLENGSTLVNLAGGVFDKQSDDALNELGTGPNRFVNQGLLRKSAGPFSSPIDVEFEQQGTVEVLAGTLQFPRGFTSRGVFSVAEGARVDLRSGVFVLEPGHAFAGPGFYGIEGGDVTVVGDLTAPNFQLRGGTLRGTNRITGTLAWTAGSLVGQPSVASGGMLHVESGSDHEFAGTLTIQNGGTLRWTAGRLYLENGSTLVNLAGGVLDKQSDDALNELGTGPNRFVNRGLLRKSAGPFSSPIDVEFAHQGTVEVLSGGIQFPRGFTSRGAFSVTEGARVDLRSGVFVFEPGHAFGGPGFYGIEGGDVTLVGDLTAPNFQLRGGTLRGTNRIAGTLVWQAGQLVGHPSVAPGGVLRIEGGADHEFTGSLTNQNGGTLRWTAGRLYLENGSTLVNQAGGVIEKQSDDALAELGVGPNRFVNQGVFRKSDGLFTAPVEVDFVQQGTVEIVSGALQFPRGFTQTAGAIRLSGGSLSAARPIVLEGGSLAGAGTVAAALVNSAQVHPGTGPGQLRIEGDYTQTATGTLNLELAGLAPEASDRLVVSGIARLDGRLDTTLVGNFVPPVHHTFVPITTGSREGTFASHRYPTQLVGLDVH